MNCPSSPNPGLYTLSQLLCPIPKVPPTTPMPFSWSHYSHRLFQHPSHSPYTPPTAPISLPQPLHPSHSPYTPPMPLTPLQRTTYPLLSYHSSGSLGPSTSPHSPLVHSLPKFDPGSDSPFQLASLCLRPFHWSATRACLVVLVPFF